MGLFLRKARRVNLSFEASGESLDGMSLVIDTEAIRYKWMGADGQFPDYEKLIPTEAKTVVHFDTVEAIKAVSSLKALADSKSYPIDLTLDNGMVILSSPDDKGQAVIPADIEGEAIKVRLDGKYLADALRACGGMVDFKLTSASAPTLFTTDGYRLVVMPMMTTESQKPAEKPEAEPEPKAEVAEAIAEAEAIAKAEVEPEPTEAKPKRKRKAKEPVAV
jgi:hypothetical protein